MYLHTWGRHYCRVMVDPLVDIKDMPEDKMWGLDQTQPTEEVKIRLQLKRQAAASAAHSNTISEDAKRLGIPWRKKSVGW
jgi:hypothetical protein